MKFCLCFHTLQSMPKFHFILHCISSLVAQPSVLELIFATYFSDTPSSRFSEWFFVNFEEEWVISFHALHILCLYLYKQLWRVKTIANHSRADQFIIDHCSAPDTLHSWLKSVAWCDVRVGLYDTDWCHVHVSRQFRTTYPLANNARTKARNIVTIQVQVQSPSQI